jgi:hypothetical protein
MAPQVGNVTHSRVTRRGPVGIGERRRIERRRKSSASWGGRGSWRREPVLAVEVRPAGEEVLLLGGALLRGVRQRSGFLARLSPERERLHNTKTRHTNEGKKYWRHELLFGRMKCAATQVYKLRLFGQPRASAPVQLVREDSR